MNTRAIIESILADLSQPRCLARDAKRKQVVDLAELNYLKEVFISGGAARIEEVANPERWLQIGIQLKSPADRWKFLDAEFLKFAEGEIRSGQAARFFFMNKPPGIRLRFCGLDLKSRLFPRLKRFLDSRVRKKIIQGYEFGAYEGETYQFGGERGLQIAHDFFTSDSAQTIRFKNIRSAAMDSSIYSLLILNDLFRKATLDRWEAWDVWRNMRLAGRDWDFSESQRKRVIKESRESLEVVRALEADPDAFLKGLRPSEARLVRQGWEANGAAANALQAADRAGVLLYGARKILPFWAVFHWNRLEMQGSTQVSLAFFMQQILDPKQ